MSKQIPESTMTEKKIEDYAFLYVGCMVRYVGMANDRVLTLRWLGSLLETEAKKNIKLILRPLSDMTDEEFTEVVMLHWNQSRDIIEQEINRIERRTELKQAVKYGTSIPYSYFNKDGTQYMNATFSPNSINPEQLKYLLSKHFDLFGLIESGIAIDKTKHKG